MANYNIDDLYRALSWAETGSSKYDDPWMRTDNPYSGSSAYGPVQLTGGGGEEWQKPSMMWNVYHDPKMAADMKITEKERNYISRFLEQADRFLDPVSDEMESTYGYAGPGVLRSDEDKALYENISKKLIKYELKRHKGNVDEFIKDWRKKKVNKVVVEDVPYNLKFKEKLAKLHGKRTMFPDETVMSELIKENVR